MAISSRYMAIKARIGELIEHELNTGFEYPSDIREALSYEGWPEEVINEVIMENYAEFPQLQGLCVGKVVLQYKGPSGNETLDLDELKNMSKEDLLQLPGMSFDEFVSLCQNMGKPLPVYVNYFNFVAIHVRFCSLGYLLSGFRIGWKGDIFTWNYYLGRNEDTIKFKMWVEACSLRKLSEAEQYRIMVNNLKHPCLV